MVKGGAAKYGAGNRKCCQRCRYPLNTKRPQKHSAGRVVKAAMYIDGKFEWEIRTGHWSTHQINNNYVVMENRMEELGNNLKVELVKSIDSAAKQCEERLGDCF